MNEKIETQEPNSEVPVTPLDELAGQISLINATVSFLKGQAKQKGKTEVEPFVIFKDKTLENKKDEKNI